MGSTNELAQQLALDGASHGTVVLADAQSEGRGRLGRKWSSPPGLNLYMSVILRPAGVPGLASSPGLVPLLAGLSVVEAIGETSGYEASLKWPNDIMAGEAKLGGILLESRSRGSELTFLVLGIGINVNSTKDDFPPDLRETATSLLIETGRPTGIEALAKALNSRLSRSLPLMDSPSGTEAVLGRYRRVCTTLGRDVIAHDGRGEIAGRAADVDAMGRLVLSAGGEMRALSSAAITLLK